MEKRKNQNNNVKSLFEFLQDFNALKTTTITNIKDEKEKKFYFKDLPADDTFLVVYNRNTTEKENEVNTGAIENENGERILSIRKPGFKECPPPPHSLKQWLLPRWDEYDRPIRVRSTFDRNTNLGDGMLEVRWKITGIETKADPWKKEASHPSASALKNKEPQKPIPKEKKAAKPPVPENKSNQERVPQYAFDVNDLAFEDMGDLDSILGGTQKKAEIPKKTESPKRTEALMRIATSSRTEPPKKTEDPDLFSPEIERSPAFGEQLIRQQEFVLKEIAPSRDTGADAVRFNQVPGLRKDLEEWAKQRLLWQEDEAHRAAVRNLFNQFFIIHQNVKQNSETVELVVANGFIKVKDQSEINYPILVKRVRITFDAKANRLDVLDADVPAELNTMLLTQVRDINTPSIQTIQKDLDTHNYHPLDHNEGCEFLKRAIHSLCPQSRFIKENEKEPDYRNDRIFLEDKPVLFLRKRPDGFDKFITKVIDDLDKTNFVPSSILTIAGRAAQEPEPEAQNEDTIEKKLAALGGEDPDILLAKPANKEQLQIAQQIERHNSVLVQGPPGTGKTHTIANLLGHFLAEGKSVLVTSYTKKALSVLKDKVPKDMQNLCVSMLDDTNQDMERSVEGIVEYLSGMDSNSQLERVEAKKKQRAAIIAKQASVRRKIFQLLHKEYESLVFEGKGLSPIEAAVYVHDEADKYKDVIPGAITIGASLPLSQGELIELYHSNLEISKGNEVDLDQDMPRPEELLQPELANRLLQRKKQLFEEIIQLSAKIPMTVTGNPDDFQFINPQNKKKIIFAKTGKNNVETLETYLHDLGKVDSWAVKIIADCQRGGGFAARWETLCTTIEQCYAELGKYYAFSVGNTVSLPSVDECSRLVEPLKKIKEELETSGSLGFFFKLKTSGCSDVLNKIKVNGHPIQNASECELVLAQINVQALRQQAELSWNQLMQFEGIPQYRELSASPEEKAVAYVKQIRRYLVWLDQDYNQLQELTEKAGLPVEDLLLYETGCSEEEKLNAYFGALSSLIPGLCAIQKCLIEMQDVETIFNVNGERLKVAAINGSTLFKRMANDWDHKNLALYAKKYEELGALYLKQAAFKRRQELLGKLAQVASGWASAIRVRSGVHAKETPPENLKEAWEWKQFKEMLEELDSQSLEELQNESARLSESYRQITTHLAADMAWLYLLQRRDADSSMQQDLMGWEQTVKKIGKGTGKRVPQLRAEARRLMARCQRSVPAWIMTIGTAMNTLDPATNKFDVIIVDEASQADITAIPILYLGKKVIIVGDDKQVSPSNIGLEIDKLQGLINAHLEGRVPNAMIYDGKTSLYDIGKQICRPLMLKEHFRCVPDIIGFSNTYFYEDKIKPLRDDSQCRLKPALVPIRVDGKRKGEAKTNEVEADMTVALIKAMESKTAYKDKTIGVISLLGSEQGELVNRRLLANNVDIVGHEIMCGNAAQFQGDERDVIILNMIDSNEKETPLAKSERAELKQRYNVAVSRAKDQVWILHSIDPDKDLQATDVRRDLLTYAYEPHGMAVKKVKIAQKADSPFEETVAEKLVLKNYQIVQQWPVGNYRIDMVVCDGDKKIALECDGDRWHSGEQKIQEDMERQTVLERLGWHFIRLRGSEYYRDPETAMARVIHDLTEYGIHPVKEKTRTSAASTALVDEIKRQACNMLKDVEKKSQTRDKAEETWPRKGYGWRQKPKGTAKQNVDMDTLFN